MAYSNKGPLEQEKMIILQAKVDKRNAKDPVELLRAICLLHGTKGIGMLQRSLEQAAGANAPFINFYQFQQGLAAFDSELDNESTVRTIYHRFASEGSMNMDYLLAVLRPKMSRFRQRWIEKALDKLDITGDGRILVDDLQRHWNAKKHPQYVNGEKTMEKLWSEFLRCFPADNGVIDKTDFYNYYAGMSQLIPDQGPQGDHFFALIMRDTYGLGFED